MFGMEGSENFYFATKSKSLNAGLEQQLVQFVTDHKDARLIIIDTLQKVREVGGDKFSYASDYEIVTKLKGGYAVILREFTPYLGIDVPPRSGFVGSHLHEEREAGPLRVLRRHGFRGRHRPGVGRCRLRSV